jgi:hypothetical protein
LARWSSFLVTLTALVLALVAGPAPVSAEPLSQAACPTPRPPVRLQTQALGDAKIQATVTAGAGALTLLRFGAMQNAHVEVPGTTQQYGSNGEIKPPSGATSFTFLLVGNPAAQAGQAPPSTTIPLTVFDGCGPDQPWSTFVGGGASALQSTASVADTQVTEGNAGTTVLTFTITLSVPSSRSVSISYATKDGTARAGTDYVAASGTVTFNPGETSKMVSVQVRGNVTHEPDKTFTITLSEPVNAGLGRAQATARIVDDDGLPVSGDDAYTVGVGQTLNVGAGSGPPPGLLANDQAAGQDVRVASFGGLSAGGDVTSTSAGSTRDLGNGGSLKVNTDGSFTFTPPGGFTGAFSFRYRTSSTAGAAEATVIVDVRAGPNAVDDTGYNAAGSAPLQVAAAGGLLANDALGTPPGTIVSFGGGSAGGSVTGTPAGQARELGNAGILTVNPDGSFRLTAPSSAAGPFTFQYRLQNAAGSDDATVTIQVQRAPTITTTSGATGFLENSGPVVVDAGATIVSPGGGNLTQLTATIGGLVDVGNEALAATTAGTSITASYAAPTLTISGNDTVAHYEQVLRSITYVNSDPTPTGGARTIALQGVAFGQQGNIATKTVAVGTVNDPPAATVLTGLAAQASIPITYPAGTLRGSDPEGSPVTPDTTPSNVTNGSVTILADGSFTFTPAPNAAGGSASFQYRVSDGTANSAYVTVSFEVAGPRLYFVKAKAAGGGDCTLGYECTLATAADSSHAGSAGNARIFIDDAGSHPSAVALATGAWLIGQGVTGASFDAVFGITPPSGPGAGTLATRPLIGAASPTVQGTVTMNDSSRVSGLKIAVTGTDMGLLVGNVGDVVVNDVPSIQAVDGRAVSILLSGGTFSVGDIAATGSGGGILFKDSRSSSTVTVNDVTTTTGDAVSITSTSDTNFSFRDVTSTTGVAVAMDELSGDVTFRAINATGGTNAGIAVDQTRSGFSMTVTGDGTTAGSGGTISGKTGKVAGITLSTVHDVTLKNMNVSGNKGGGLSASNVLGTLTLANVTAKESVNAPVVRVTNSTGSGSLDISNSTFSNNSALFQNLVVVSAGGTSTAVRVTESSFSRDEGSSSGGDVGIGIAHDAGTMDVEIDHSSFSKVGLPISYFVSPSASPRTSKVNIHDNASIVDFGQSGIQVMLLNSNVNDVYQVKIEKNGLGEAGAAGSGGRSFGSIYVMHFGEGTLNALIQENTIQEIADGNPIFVQSDPVADPSTQVMNVTIQKNSIDQIRGSASFGIFVETFGSSPVPACLNIVDNSITNFAFKFIQIFLFGGSVSVPDNVVQKAPTAAVDAAELDDANGVPGAASVSGTYKFGQPACTLPSF